MNVAFPVFDSFGKPESGLLSGNYKWQGSYPECTKIHQEYNNSNGKQTFNGRYCVARLGLSVKPENKENLEANAPGTSSGMVGYIWFLKHVDFKRYIN